MNVGAKAMPNEPLVSSIYITTTTKGWHFNRVKYLSSCINYTCCFGWTRASTNHNIQNTDGLNLHHRSNMSHTNVYDKYSVCFYIVLFLSEFIWKFMTFMGCAEMVNYVNSNGEREIPPIELEKLNLTVLMGRSMFYAFFQAIPFRRQIKNAF